MNRSLALILVILVILVFVPPGCLASGIPDDLQIITENYAPFNFMENGTLRGISVDLAEEVLARMGSTITRDSFQVLPWNEAYNRVRTTPDTILLTTDRLPERENLFLWAGPVITDQEVLFTLAETNLSGIYSLENLTIVAIQDDCGKGYAIQAGADEQNIIEVPLSNDAIRLIENGSADAWVYSEMPGQHAIDQFAVDPSRFVAGKELGTSRYYFAFNPDTPVELVTAFNNTLHSCRLDRVPTGVTTYERIVARYLPVQCVNSSSDPGAVMNLVNLTALAIAKDAPGTIDAINAGQDPYLDPADPDLYVFVFDSRVHLKANAVNPALVGKNLTGTTDAYGKPFRDEMVTGALQNGTGWVSYVYSNPDSLGLYQKMSYYRLAVGSDKVRYIIGGGRYKTCNET